MWKLQCDLNSALQVAQVVHFFIVIVGSLLCVQQCALGKFLNVRTFYSSTLCKPHLHRHEAMSTAYLLMSVYVCALFVNVTNDILSWALKVMYYLLH